MNLKCLIVSLVLVLLMVTTDPVMSKKKSKTKSSSGKTEHTHSRTKTRTSTTMEVLEDSNPTDSGAAVVVSDDEPTRPGAQIVLSSSGVVLPPYSQLSSAQLTASSGVQCNGGTGSSSARWVLPNGEALDETSTSTSSADLLVRRNPSPAEPNVELLRNSSTAGSVGIEGVFWCIVEYSDYTDVHPVWILENSTPPSVTASSCEFSGLNPSDSTIGVYLMANISNGAPTAVSCSLGAQGTAVFRQVFETQPPTEAGMRVVTSIPISSVPGSLVCTVSNSDGSDTFTCDIQATTLGTPVINEITRDSEDSSIVTVTWSSVSDPNGVLDSYMVYVISSNGKAYVPFQQIEVVDTQARIRGVYPGYSYQVVVTAVSSSLQVTQSNQLTAPSISAAGEITMSQCKPAQGQNVEIKLTKMNNCEDVEDCSDRTVIDNQGLARAALAQCGTGLWNCTAMEPQITKVYCREDSEATPRQSSKTKQYNIKIKAMAVCNACTSGYSSESTKSKTPNRGKRARLLRQIIDNSECVVTYEGCEYSVNIDTKYGPKSLCGYSSTSSKQKTCDCPEQCYHNYIQNCENSCSCGT